MSIITKTCLLIISLWLVSCNITSQNKLNENKIYSDVIQNLPVLPPPSLKIIQNDSLLKKYKDSLKNKKIIIYINKNFTNPKINIDNLSYPNNSELFKNLIRKLNNSKRGQIDVLKINNNENVVVKVVDSIPNLEFHPEVTQWYMRFSEIILSNKNGIGVLYSSAHSSKLSGSYRIHFLKFENGKWNIIKTSLLEIS